MGKHKRGKAYLRKLQDFRLRRFLREGADDIQKHPMHRPCLVSNRGQTWKPTKGMIG
jgi:hypothetical protein